MSNIIYDAETNVVYWDELLKIPEFKALSKTPQNILWHKEGNVYVHTRIVTECMLKHISDSNDVSFVDYEYREILIWGSLLHDIGKVVTTEKGADGLYHCKNHAIKGVDIADNIINTYVPEISKYSKKAILSLVRYHMQPLYILDYKDSENAILKLANNLNGIDFESLLLLKKCDCEGSITEKEDYHDEILERVRKLFYKVCSYPSGTKVKIEKLKDSITCKYKPGCHPNGINTGYVAQGYLVNPVTVGYRTFLGFRFSTSPVTKIIDKNHFETENSIYEITEVKDE